MSRRSRRLRRRLAFLLDPDAIKTGYDMGLVGVRAALDNRNPCHDRVRDWIDARLPAHLRPAGPTDKEKQDG